MSSPKARSRSYWGLVLHEFMKRRLAVAASAVVVVLILIAVLAPYVANSKPIIMTHAGKTYFPSTFTYAEFRSTDWAEFVENLPEGYWVLMPPVQYGPNATDLFERVEKPSKKHLMGTDDLGRDVLARMIWGIADKPLGRLRGGGHSDAYRRGGGRGGGVLFGQDRHHRLADHRGGDMLSGVFPAADDHRARRAREHLLPHARHRHSGLDGRGEADTRRVSQAARAGLRGGGARARRARAADHFPPHTAQRDSAGACLRRRSG